MVRPLLLSADTRGNFEPILALAESPDLENPVLFVQPEYQSLAPRAHILPYSIRDILTSFAHAKSFASPYETYIETTLCARGQFCANFVLPSVDAVLEVAWNSSIDVVLSTTLSWMVAHIVAEKLHVPFVLLTFQPCLRSLFVPNLFMRPLKVAIAFEKLLNDESPEVDYEILLLILV